MAGLKESSCGGFSMGKKHGSVDTSASENGMFVTLTLFDEQALGEKGFISAYLQTNWDDFIETFRTVNREIVKTKVQKKGSTEEKSNGAAERKTCGQELIRMGKMKGRTVRAALEEFGRKELEGHLAYVEGKEAEAPGRFKANAALIADMKAVLAEPEKNEADAPKDEQAPVVQSTYTIWADNDWKSSPTQKNKQGWPLCTKLQITGTPGSETPYFVSIEQGYAPVRELDNGLMAIELSKMDKETKKSANMFVTRKDMVNTMEEADRRVYAYRMMKAGELNHKQMTTKYK